MKNPRLPALRGIRDPRRDLLYQVRPLRRIRALLRSLQSDDEVRPTATTTWTAPISMTSSSLTACGFPTGPTGTSGSPGTSATIGARTPEGTGPGPITAGPGFRSSVGAGSPSITAAGAGTGGWAGSGSPTSFGARPGWPGDGATRTSVGRLCRPAWTSFPDGASAGNIWNIPGHSLEFRPRPGLHGPEPRPLGPAGRTERPIVDMTDFDVNINVRDRRIVNDGVDPTWSAVRPTGRSTGTPSRKRPGRASSGKRATTWSSPDP